MAIDQLNQELRNIYDERRQKALADYDQRMAQIYQSHPELKPFDQAVNDAGYELARLSMEGSEEVLAKAEKKLKDAKNKREQKRRELGLSEQDFEMKFHCPACEDQGYINGEPCGVCFAQTRGQLLQDRFNMVMPNAGNLENYSTLSFETTPYQLSNGKSYSPREAMESYLEEAKDFVAKIEEREPFSLFFAGGTGTGKSTLAAAIGQTLLEQGYAVIYISAYELAAMLEERRTLRKSYNPDPERLSAIEGNLQILQRCDLLIVDDLGDEREVYRQSPSDFLQLINERYPANKKMIWIANDSPDVIKEAYSETIFSRLFGYGKTLYFFGKDLRIQDRLARS